MKLLCAAALALVVASPCLAADKTKENKGGKSEKPSESTEQRENLADLMNSIPKELMPVRKRNWSKTELVKPFLVIPGISCREPSGQSLVRG